MAQFGNLLRIHQEIAERYCYLPSVGLMVFLSTLIYHSPVLSAIFVTMYATKLWFYMDSYTDDYYLTETASLNSPDAWFSWHVRAMKRWEMKSHQEAFILWSMAHRISPREFKINFNLATALKLSGRAKEAEQFLKIAEDNVPEGQEEQTSKMLSDWKEGRMAILL